MNITIGKSEIYNEVEKRTSLEGFVYPENFDKVWANESRGELLDSYWVEGYTAVIQLLKRYLSSASVDAFGGSDFISITLNTPERYDSNLEESIKSDIKMMLACNILTGWINVVMPEAAPKYEEEAKGYSEDLRVKLLYRKEPTRTFASAKTDTESMTQLWGRCPNSK